MPYISKEGQLHIKSFKYKGNNLSLSYKYLWSPIAEKLLQWTPSTIAPNTITLVGFLLHTIATIILCLQGPFGSDAPRWSLFLYAFCVCAYQMLDNVDGKQARKIQNSTPLGMIMDHGCDALGVICLTAGMGRVVCMNDPLLFLWTYVFVMFSFYISAWCQYWSNGIMILGKFNGVDDGIPIIWCSALVSGFLGQQFWRTPIQLFGSTYQLNRIIAVSIIVASIIQIMSVKAQAGQEFTKEVSQALYDLLHALLILITLFLVTRDSQFVSKYVVGICLGLSFTLSRTVTYTLVCSTAKMHFEQFTPSTLVFTITYASHALFNWNTLSDQVVVYGVAIFAVVAYLIYVFSVSRQIADILQIRIFHVFKVNRNS